ncbi:hypothetical protein [Clostridium sp.]|jgi:preprotein translocase subunit SecG|nr:hypothetical protein [Clostridium sp.]MDF2504309.1 hypothetical protein [Clostridium sp.]
MKEFLFPWQAHVLEKHPFALIIFIFVISIILSIFTWIREKNQHRK